MRIQGYIRIPFEYEGEFEPDSEGFYAYLDEYLYECTEWGVDPTEVEIVEAE